MRALQITSAVANVCVLCFAVLYAIDAFGSLERPLQDDMRSLPLGLFSVAVVGTVITSTLLRRPVEEGVPLGQIVDELETDLFRAARVQAELLADEVLELEEFEFAAVCIPAGKVGGDFYDWTETPTGNVAVTLGDVMGRGMPAALVMATTRAVVRATCRENPPAQAMNLAAHILEEDLLRSASFVTLFHAQLDVVNRCVSYVDAGHGHALVMRGDGTWEELRESGLPLGILAEEEYREGSVVLNPGDALIVFSDGLVETHSVSTPGVATVAAQLQGATSAADMVNTLAGSAQSLGTPADDLSVMALYCHGVLGTEPLPRSSTSRDTINRFKRE